MNFSNSLFSVKFRKFRQTLIISLVLSILISLLFIRPGYEYIVELKDKQPADPDKAYYYNDLNNDGKTDRVFRYTPSRNKTSLIVYHSSGKIVEQFNFNGRFVRLSDLYFHDFDSNGLNEVYFFSHLEDSLFLNIFEPFHQEDYKIKSVFIDIARLEDDQANYRITGSSMEDTNRDGFYEFYFFVTAGFSLSPRNLYYYDLQNNVVKKSPPSYSGPTYGMRTGDIDNDGFLEFWGPVPGWGNCTDQEPYSDQKTWLMIFTHDLKFKFSPIGFEQFPAIISPILLKTREQNYLVVTYNYRGNNPELKNQLFLYDVKGNLLKKIYLDQIGIHDIGAFFTNKDNIYIQDYKKGLLVNMNKDLEVKNSIKKDLLTGSLYGPFDLDNDGRKEFIVSQNNKSYFIDLRGNQIAELVLDNHISTYTLPVPINDFDGFTGYQIAEMSFDYLFTFHKSDRWPLFIIKCALLFISVFLVVFVIQFLQIIQERKKQEVEKQLKAYQLQSIKNQINPHFIFNALNSISAMYMIGNNEEAESFLMSFSKLMREVVETSDRIIVKLSDEIRFISHYLEIEKVRLGSSFRYTIDIPDNCMNIKFPSMCLHAFVENAIKHGLSNKSDEKELLIKGKMEKNYLHITVQDNGPGLKKSTRNENIFTGKGNMLVSRAFEGYEKLSGKKISYSITSADDKGARVDILIAV